MQVPDNVVSGEVECIAGESTRLDDVPCRLVYLQASAENTGNITLGGNEVDDGSRGLVIEPGEKLPSMLVDNLNRFYMYGAEGDRIFYMVIR